jgi:hypothetical protein
MALVDSLVRTLPGDAGPPSSPTGSKLAQQGSPAMPRSLPTQRTSGPTSLKTTASGCMARIISQVRGQS